MRDRTLDSVATIADNGGRVVLVTATGGALAAAAVVGAQVAGSSTVDAAPAGAKTKTTSTGSKSAGPTAATPSPSPSPSSRESQTVSRDAARPSLSALKKKAQDEASDDGATATAGIITEKATIDVSDPRTVARNMLGEFGWSEGEFTCLDALWVGESNWRVNADNPSSSAYGIPQALPGSKMASAGPDWATNPATQIKWGLGYIKGRYGSPCGAQSFKQGHGWY